MSDRVNPRTLPSRISGGLRFAVTLPILLYQKVISPVLPGSCIYTPSCSHYARTAVMRHGILKGLVLALFRVFRCTGGLFSGGDDPVPPEPSLHYLLGSYRRFWRWSRRPSVR